MLQVETAVIDTFKPSFENSMLTLQISYVWFFQILLGLTLKITEITNILNEIRYVLNIVQATQVAHKSVGKYTLIDCVDLYKVLLFYLLSYLPTNQLWLLAYP